MKFSKTLAALTVAGSTIAFSAPATSAPLTLDNGLRSSAAVANGVETVQWRGHRGWHGNRGWRGGPRYGYRGGYYRRGPGAGAVIGGLAAGAIIGGAIANSQAQAQSNAAYCAQRYRSYDPASGTYLNYDGNRYPCP